MIQPRTPTLAILWQLWRRHRWALIAGWAYLVLGAVVCRLPITLHMRIDETQVPAVAYFFGVTSLWIVLHLVAMFSFSSPAAKETGFPTHMFTMPAPTRTLVAVPMVAGGLTIGFVWLVIAGVVLRPGGITAPLWWPILGLVLLLVGLQAVAWMPFAKSWLRFVVAVPLLVALIGGPLATAGLGKPPDVMVMLVGLAIAGLTAYAAVAKARRGEFYDLYRWRWPGQRITTRRRQTMRPFASAAAAQLWFECRAHAWVLPLMLAVTLAGLLFVLLVDRHNAGSTWIYTGGGILLFALAVPPITAGIIGSTLAKQDQSSKYALFSFLGVRPLSTTALVRAKFAMAAVSTLAACIAVLAFVALLLLLRPSFCSLTVEMAREIPAWKVVGSVLLAAIAYFLVTWKHLVEALWIGLTGRAWVGNAAAIGLGLLFFAAMAFAWWVYLHPEQQARLQTAVPWLLALLVLVKFVAAAGVLRGLDRQRLIRRQTLATMIGIWSLIVVVLCLSTFWLVPSQIPIPLWSIVCGIVLMVPFTRLAAAPLALAWNRHR